MVDSVALRRKRSSGAVGAFGKPVVRVDATTAASALLR